MAVKVDLEWSEGDPCLSITPEGDDLHAVVDVRLSEAQVLHACRSLGETGTQVLEAWRAKVGLSRQQLAV